MAIEINIVDAIGSLYKGKYYSASSGTDSEGNAIPIIWKDGHTTTDEENTAINTELIRLKAEYDSNAYQRNRAAEYPEIVDQLDDIYHNGIEGWKSTIKIIKDKYPA